MSFAYTADTFIISERRFLIVYSTRKQNLRATRHFHGVESDVGNGITSPRGWFRTVGLTLLVLAWSALSTPAWGQSGDGIENKRPYQPGTHTLVLAFGLGDHSFSSNDGMRGNITGFQSPSVTITEGGDKPIEDAGLRSFSIEYFFGRFGLGLKHLEIVEDDARSLFGQLPDTSRATVSQHLLIRANIITAHFMFPISRKENIFLGIMIGAGPVNYKTVFEIFDDGRNQIGSRTYTASGAAGLAGIFADFGGRGFGARFGWQWLNTSLSDFTPSFGKSPTHYTADAGGTEVYVSLRYAF